MTEVRRVVAQIRAPAAATDLGQISEGFYIVQDGVLIMTNPGGTPIDGQLYRHRLAPDENPEPVARMLTKQIRRAKLGISAGEEAFGRPLRYQDQGRA